MRYRGQETRLTVPEPAGRRLPRGLRPRAPARFPFRFSRAARRELRRARRTLHRPDPLPTASAPPDPPAGPAFHTQAFHGTRAGSPPRFSSAATLRPGACSTARPSSSNPSPPSWSNPAGRAGHPHGDLLLTDRMPSAPPATNGALPDALVRHRRPRRTRTFPPPLHLGRRADGRGAPAHGPVHQRQGTARFLLRPLRCRRLASSPTPRTSPSTSARCRNACAACAPMCPTCGPARSTSPTILSGAAATCPT